MDAPLGGCYILCYLLSFYQLVYGSIEPDTSITRAAVQDYCLCYRSFIASATHHARCARACSNNYCRVFASWQCVHITAGNSIFSYHHSFHLQDLFVDIFLWIIMTSNHNYIQRYSMFYNVKQRPKRLYNILRCIKSLL